MKKKVIAMLGAGIFGASILLSSAGCMFFPGLETKTENKPYQKTYTVKQLQQIEASSFKKLNNVQYPDATNRQVYPVSEEYRNAMYEFALNVYRNRESGADFSFSPLGLYTNLSLLSLASDNETALGALDGVLGMSKETRKEDFVNMYKTNYFCNASGTMQQYNASFQSTKWGYNQAYVDSLTEHYAEAYQVDFASNAGVNKMLEWVDGKVGEKNFLQAKDLEIKEDTALLLFSTLLFDNKWGSTYNDANSYQGTFYAADGEKKATFMQHSYIGDCYDYEDYIACYDYYQNGMKIKYVLPKAQGGDIYALTKGKDLLRDDESCKIHTTDPYDDSLIVNLTLPKFSKECMVDFSPVLKSIGLSHLFEKGSCSFNYAFTGLTADESAYLSFVKQKNKVSFSEEGTTIKSVTISQADMAMSAAPMDTIDITLDQPFIYVVYDANDLPVYFGNVDRV